MCVAGDVCGSHVYRSLLQNIVSFVGLFCKRDLWFWCVWKVKVCRISRVQCFVCRSSCAWIVMFGEEGGWGRDPFSRNFMEPTPRRKWYLTTGRSFHEMVLDPIPQSLPVHYFGSRPQPPHLSIVMCVEGHVCRILCVYTVLCVQGRVCMMSCA